LTSPPAPPPGRVSLVGAGPGDRDLITLRAADRLRSADVVLYDDLASGAVLDLIRPGAERVAVGKRAGRPSPKQAEVSRLIVDYARLGLNVVRLKAGDPTVFGRVDEEIEALIAAGIDFEIVPGIASPLAAAAEAGMSLSKRLVARRVQFVTGHDVDGELPKDLDLAALADPGATTCVFMGKGTFGALVEALVLRGLAPETPAVMAVSLGTPEKHLVHSTIRQLAADLAMAKPKGPAMILYGAALAPRDATAGD
jgi:uroporphyrin-III C-methyltransferase